METTELGSERQPKVSKGVISQFLRTSCRRQLYLSIYAPLRAQAPFATENLPPPAKWRPGIVALTRSGRSLESERFEELSKAFPERMVNFSPKGKPQKTKSGLKDALIAGVKRPYIFMEGEFQASQLSQSFYEILGIGEGARAKMPMLADLRPDVIIALDPHSHVPSERRVRAVLADGATQTIASDDQRIWLLPIDIKRSEAINASYAIEVTLYAVLLALWLKRVGLADKYLVVDHPALWMLDPPDSKPLDSLVAIPAEARVAALMQRVEFVEFDQYAVSMRKIFREDLVAVASTAGWSKLEPHVGSYCGMCDFFANPSWAPKNKATGEKEPVHSEHCSNKVQDVDHLSRIPDVSRGMARTLSDGAVGTVSLLSTCPPDHAIFGTHNRLAAERRLLPQRATHLLAGTRAATGRQCATLPRFSHLSAYIFVNFDAATGFTTGLSVYGSYRPHRAFGAAPKPAVEGDDPKRRPEAWTVEQRDLDHEFEGLQRVMYYLADLIERAQKDPRHDNVTEATLQIHFWDVRQFEHFRTVVGRHLHRLLGDPKLTGLIWLFPPEEVMGHPQYALTPAVSFIKDAIRRLEILPVPHVQTLLAVGDVLLEDKPKVSAFQREPLSDAIPKERIYEIWEKQHVSNRQEQISAYNHTLRTLVMTLMRVTLHVQQTFKGKLTAVAPPLALMRLPDYRGVSLDGQLLILHTLLEEQTEIMSSKASYGRDPDELEAEYVSIRLTNRLKGQALNDALTRFNRTQEADLRVYEVTVTSRNSKLKIGDQVTYFVDARPGLLNRKASQELGSSGASLGHRQYTSVASALQATIVEFDRVNGIVVVDHDGFYWTDVGRALVKAGIDLDAGCSLVSGPPFTQGAHRKEQFVRAIGNPAIAQPHSQALAALCKRQNAIPKPTKQKASRGAEALWDAPSVAATSSRWKASGIAAALNWLRKQGHPINSSQETALRAALRYCLAQVWGPPGTGKTMTGAAICAAELFLATEENSATNVLVTGPNYQAVETLYQDLLPLLGKLGSNCRVRWINREEQSGTAEKSLDYKRIERSEIEQLRQELKNRDGATIVFSVVHQLFNLAGLPGKNAKKQASEPMLEAFDLVMIDEASQVDVAHAVGALALLATSGRLVLLGDRLQMPPISKIEPPKGCEFIVGSILDYFHHRFRDLLPSPLLTNYRSSEPLVAFARELGYPAELKAEFPDTRLSLNQLTTKPVDWPSTLPWSTLFPALLNPTFATMAVTYPDGKAGQANAFEADLVAGVVALARRTMRRGLEGRSKVSGDLDVNYFWTQAVGIVTPHRAQRAAVIRALTTAFPTDDPALIENAVDTVERFQGGERDLILVSFGVGDPDLVEAEEEFLLGLNRTNVAISRARAKAIVFVSDDLSYHLPDDAEVVRTARAVKGFVHQYCHEHAEHLVPTNSSERRVTLRWRGDANS